MPFCKENQTGELKFKHTHTSEFRSWSLDEPAVQRLALHHRLPVSPAASSRSIGPSLRVPGAITWPSRSSFPEAWVRQEARAPFRGEAENLELGERGQHQAQSLQFIHDKSR